MCNTINNDDDNNNNNNNNDNNNNNNNNNDNNNNNNNNNNNKIGKGKEKNNVILHLLFMDDLKLYASNDNQLKTLLETVKTFSKNIGMAFGLEKCAKMTIIKGKKTSTENITLTSNETIKELENSQFYKYL